MLNGRSPSMYIRSQKLCLSDLPLHNYADKAGMDAPMKGIEVFVIAHRLFMVLDHGRIIERVAYGELIGGRGKCRQRYADALQLG